MNGVLAHLVERSYGIAEVASSSLAHSTTVGAEQKSQINLRFFEATPCGRNLRQQISTRNRAVRLVFVG